MIKSFLAHPLTRGLDLDGPETTALRRRIIQEKAFLKQIYLEWYAMLMTPVPAEMGGSFLELGAGGGFLKILVPDLIASDVLFVPGLDILADGQNLPFGNESLKAILLTNVFHHIPNPRIFLKEAARCVRTGGVIVMVEPWNTPWSHWVYTNMHDEPFQTDAKEWGFPKTGPLSGSNQALPWIVFERDRDKFENDVPEWQIESILPMMPFRYLLSGGVSMRSLMPGWTFGGWRWLEKRLARWNQSLAMFAHITLRRK